MVTRFTSPKVRFKQTESSISRRIELFEPRHVSAAVWVQSNSASAVYPRAGSTSPNWAIDPSVFAASALSSFDFALQITYSTVPAR